uniref:Neur_chan_LBD domain-containing protein n=1 Tax=Steinernema glaseri TaxID=37863 RepID=A0A1I7ZVN6_9BILA
MGLRRLCGFLACGLCLIAPCIGASYKGLEGQLYEDLLYDYNKIPRPVKNSTDVLMVAVGASLIRIIDVDEKNQVLTTNLWLEMKWVDAKLQWDPKKYGGITTLHIPSDLIWTPDLVLYNNAAGDPDITIFTDALVAYDGRVFWQPPAIYKSFCPIDVTWFPYDLQNCNMKFGAWSYTGYYVDLRQLPSDQVMVTKDSDGSDVEFMENGMDLSFFYKSAEWDLLSLTSARHSVLYASCCGPEKYVDITYYLVLRRKTLFFTCNLIIPCFLISLLTTFVFYLSDHKITFSISILVTLTVFFLVSAFAFDEFATSRVTEQVLIDIMPPTSLVIPMFGRYLITTMILVALSTVVSVVTVNFRFRSGSAHKMSPWIRSIFLKFLPKVLMMKRPDHNKVKNIETNNGLVEPSALITPHSENCHQRSVPRKTLKKDKLPNIELNSYVFSRPSTSLHVSSFDSRTLPYYTDICNNQPRKSRGSNMSESYTTGENEKMGSLKNKNKVKDRVHDVIFTNLLQQVRFVAEHFKRNEQEAEISDDWTFVAMVLDRLFLIIFSVLNVATFFIILEAPSLYDTREPLNITVPHKPLGQANLYRRLRSACTTYLCGCRPTTWIAEWIGQLRVPEEVDLMWARIDCALVCNGVCVCLEAGDSYSHYSAVGVVFSFCVSGRQKRLTYPRETMYEEQIMNCVQISQVPFAWGIHIVEITVSLLALIMNCAVATFVYNAIPISQPQRRALAALTLNYGCIAGYQLARNIYYMVSMHSACMNAVTTASCKLQEFPILFAYVHCVFITALIAMQSLEDLHEDRRPIYCANTWSIQQSILVVFSLCLSLYFTAFDIEKRTIAMPECSLLMAIQDDMKCYILLTILMCPHVIYAFYFGILRKVQLRNTDFRLLHTMSMKEIVGLESSLWMILMLLSGSLTLVRFVALYSNGKILTQLFEISFVLGPLAITFAHPFLLLWHNICVRNSAVRTCPSLRSIMPSYEPVTPPMPRRVVMNNAYGNNAPHAIPIIRMSM